VKKDMLAVVEEQKQRSVPVQETLLDTATFCIMEEIADCKLSKLVDV